MIRKRHLVSGFCLFTFLTLTAQSCDTETQTVKKQQDRYLKVQPIPTFDWSLERQALIELIRIRNETTTLHSVWYSQTGKILGDCPSSLFHLPYDTSLTNPLKKVEGSSAVLEQAEANGIYLSKNSKASWVFCTNAVGGAVPLLIESDVNTYPFTLKVDYEKNIATPIGQPTIKLSF